MASSSKYRRLKAVAALNYDLFQPEQLPPPAPATLYTKITEAARLPVPTEIQPPETDVSILPDEKELSRRFDMYNWMYFGGKLPKPTIRYSRRMMAAGSYAPADRMLKIGLRYHELFPEEIDDTLKHEMIHIVHLRHNAAFKAEATRIGASLRARSHPLLRRPPKYEYMCDNCGRKYPRRKRLRMASCGVCSVGGRYDSRYKLRLVSSMKKQ